MYDIIFEESSGGPMKKIEFQSILKVMGLDNKQGYMVRKDEKVDIYSLTEGYIYHSKEGYVVFVSDAASEGNIADYLSDQVKSSIDVALDWNVQKITMNDRETSLESFTPKIYYIYSTDSLLDILSKLEHSSEKLEEHKKEAKRETLRRFLSSLRTFVKKSVEINNRNRDIRRKTDLDSLDGSIIRELLELDDLINPFQKSVSSDVRLKNLIKNHEFIIEELGEAIMEMSLRLPNASINIKFSNSTYFYTFRTVIDGTEVTINHDYYMSENIKSGIGSLKIDTREMTRDHNQPDTYVTLFISYDKIRTENRKLENATEEDKEKILKSISEIKEQARSLTSSIVRSKVHTIKPLTTTVTE